MVTWKFESSQVSQPVRRLETLPSVISETPANGGFSGHGRTCCWLDPVAMDPKRTVDPSAILTARVSFRSCPRFPICLHSQTGAGLFAPYPMAETKGLRCVEALLLYQTRPAVGDTCKEK
jgi:hypothetical protein